MCKWGDKFRMYKRIRIHKDLIKDIQAKGGEIGLTDLTSQVSYLIRRGIEVEKGSSNVFKEHTCLETSHILNQ